MSDPVVTILSEPQNASVSLPDMPVVAVSGQPLTGGGVTDHGQLTGLLDDDHPQYLTQARADAQYLSYPVVVDNDDKTVEPLVVNRSATSDSVNDADTLSVQYLGARAFWTNEVGLPRAQVPEGKPGEVALKLLCSSADFQTDALQVIGPGAALLFKVGRYGGVTIAPTATAAEGLKVDMPAGASNSVKVTRNGADVFRIGASDKVNVHFGMTMNSSKIEAVATPTASTDAANKAYVDGRIWKGTQAAYDAIGTKDPAVLYVVTG